VLNSQGVSETMIGLNTMAQAVSIVLIAPIGPRLLKRYSPARLMRFCIIALAVLLVLLGAFPNVYAWFPLRFLIGAAVGMLWMTCDTAVNELSEEHNRGKIIGIYSAAAAGGFALGPLVLIATGTDGFLPFLAASVITFLAGTPLFLATATKLREDPQGGASLWQTMKMAPVIMLISVLYAAGIESFETFFPLFALDLGMTEKASLGILTVFGIGAMCLSLPLGWLADHMNRLVLLIICIILSGLCFLALPYIMLLPVIAPLFVFFFGGIDVMIGTLGIVLMGERFKGGSLAAATATFTAMWGMGAMLGPPIVGAAMDVFGTDAMSWLIALIYAVFLPLPIISLIQGRLRKARQELAEN